MFTSSYEQGTSDESPFSLALSLHSYIFFSLGLCRHSGLLSTIRSFPSKLYFIYIYIYFIFKYFILIEVYLLSTYQCNGSGKVANSFLNNLNILILFLYYKTKDLKFLASLSIKEAV